MTYHITKKGTPAICNAKPGNCYLGGSDEHFETMEEALENLDLINEKRVLADKYPQTTKTSLIKYGKLDEVYNLNYERQIAKIEKKLAHLERTARQRCPKKDKKAKDKYVQQFKQSDATYQTLSMERNNKLKEVNQMVDEREQVSDFILKTKENIQDFSFSKASSSTYILYNADSAKKVIQELEESGFNIRVRPNIDSSLDTNYMVRFANHYPKEFYKRQRRGDNFSEEDVWKCTDATILVTFKQPQNNKANKKEISEKINNLTKNKAPKLSLLHESLDNKIEE